MAFAFVAFLGLLARGWAAPGVRVVDAQGTSSNSGLLQVSTENGYGTVCGSVNAAAADVACRSLGFDFGVVAASCATYGGEHLCGEQGSAVAMKDLVCSGAELSLSECSWTGPDASCASHALDAVIYCGRHEPPPIPAMGAMRLLDASGAPALDGAGRLEVFAAGAWTGVCVDKFAAGSAAVACGKMGFAGSQSAAVACKGVGLCAEPPSLGEMACTGSEDSLLECPHAEGEDVYCAAEEAVVLRCAGDGDSTGLA